MTDESLKDSILSNARKTYRNLSHSELIEAAIVRGEGNLSSNGALVVRTSPHTGRLPEYKYVVQEPGIKNEIDWGKINQPIPSDIFENLYNKVVDYLKDKEIFVFDGYVGADPNYRLNVQVISQRAWHSLFAQTLFICPTHQELTTHQPDYTVIDIGALDGKAGQEGFMEGKPFIVLSFAKKTILVGGTDYAGEIKKGIFTVMNFILPQKEVFPMHCAANMGADGSTALFFGLSGTGKTTLSADPGRKLIGDDEHGWSNDGVFNFEGGCYAKTIRLSKEGEPQIWNAIRFGSILENVILDESRATNFNDDSITENTRGTYPLSYIENSVIPSVGGHPKNVIFLSCDAFGVLPPISRLNNEQAMYYFISGYTAKVAGTEVGIKTPQLTFSACFSAPFLPRHPMAYAEMLNQKIQKHNVNVWLVNTGWTGGSHGVGSRIKLNYTRAIIDVALSGQFENVSSSTDPIFGFSLPRNCPGVPEEILWPRSTWKDSHAYDTKA